MIPGGHLLKSSPAGDWRVKDSIDWLPKVAGLYAAVGGLLTVLGWWLDLPKLADWDNDGITMQPNTGLLALLIGTALLSSSRTLNLGLGAMTLAVGASTLLEHLFDVDFGIDQILMFNRHWGGFATVSPGRMGLPSSLAWTLAGTAVVFRDGGFVSKGIRSKTIPLFGLLIAVIASLSLIGYLFGADMLFALPRYTAIAFQTGTIVFAVGVGLIATEPDFRPVWILTGDNAGSVLARRALPVIILLPLIFGSLCIRGQRSGLYDAPMAIALLVLSLILTLCAVLWWSISAVVSREESLRRSEERFSRFMERLPGLAWIKDHEGRYVYINKAAEEVFGISRTSIQGKTDGQVFPPETATQFRKNDEKALLGDKGVQIVETLTHDDGIVHHSIVSKFPMIGSEGDSPLVGGIAIDITDRKRAEETVRSLLSLCEQLNSTLSTDELLDLLVREAIKLVGAEAGLSGLMTSQGLRCTKYFKDGEFIQHEHVWPPFSGVPGWLIIHKRPYVAHDARTDVQFSSDLCHRFGVRSAISIPILTATSQVIGFFEIHNKVDTGGFTALDQELLVAVSQSAAIAVQNALAYRALQEVEESLTQSDRRKDQFLAVLAHELRNPLAPIRNGLEILKRTERDSSMFRDSLSAMDRQISHMVRLVDDLLDLSRISHDKLELRRQTVDLGFVIRQAIETCQPIADRQHQQIHVDLCEQPVSLDVDPVRLAQVFSNLLNNACKFSPPRSSIEIIARREGSKAVIAVTDHGQGILPENLERVFKMFEQLDHPIDRPHGGLGIGLSLAKRLVEMHGGQISAQSAGPGRGSRFEVHLPISLERQIDECPPDPEVVDSSKPSRFLVVDDNQDSAMTLAMLVKLKGHQALMAHDGVEALKLAESYRPQVILLDIGLPKMNGRDTCRAIRQTSWGKEITIIALTGWGQEEDRRQSRDAGFDGHLVKPINHNALLELLAELHAMPS